MGYIGILKWKQISTNVCFRLRIYLRTNKTLIHNSFYIMDSWGWGEDQAIKRCSTFTVRKIFPEVPNLARVIGNMDNQETDEWDSAVLIRNMIANSHALSTVSVSNNVITSNVYCKNC